MDLIKKHEKGRIIIYYATQLRCNDLFVILQLLLPNNNLSVYHGGLDNK